MLTYEPEFLVSKMLATVCGHNVNNPKPHDLIYSIVKKFNIKIWENWVVI